MNILHTFRFPVALELSFVSSMSDYSASADPNLASSDYTVRNRTCPLLHSEAEHLHLYSMVSRKAVSPPRCRRHTNKMPRSRDLFIYTGGYLQKPPQQNCLSTHIYIHTHTHLRSPIQVRNQTVMPPTPTHEIHLPLTAVPPTSKIPKKWIAGKSCRQFAVCLF